ncbi:MAG: hypothetical protein LBN95_01145 [Prevotellaceae bacterium]|jgi:hypothetical protein|nr:hypothetical protein [Prevotellaceae bacterium]
MNNQPHIHIGKLIQQKVKEKKISITDFADKICCVRENVYHIFKSPTIDIRKLEHISNVLDYDFVKDVYLKHRYNYNAYPTEINIKISDIKNIDDYHYIFEKIKDIENFITSQKA